MTGTSRVQDPYACAKLMPSDAAAALIEPGATIEMSGFTGSG